MDDPEGRFGDLAVADRPVFKLLVRAEPGVDAIRALRHVLKAMRRGYGLRCLSVTQVTQQPEKR